MIVFVHDRQTGITSRVSVDSSGTQGNEDSPQGDAGFEAPVMSSDGSLVAFASFASNLVPGDTNGAWDIFVNQQIAVGGIAELPGVDDSSIETNKASDGSVVVAVSVAAAVLAGAITLGGAAWYLRRR